MRLALLLALAPLGLLAQGPPAAQSPCNSTPAYSTCEITFELPEKDAANAYAGVDLKIDFRSRRRTYSMPGYWDGGRRMVVRFSPVEAGQWDYRVTSNIGAWDGQEGSFIAAASDAPGFVRPASVHHWAYTERNLPHLCESPYCLDPRPFARLPLRRIEAHPGRPKNRRLARVNCGPFKIGSA